jgi:hypothetical protein
LIRRAVLAAAAAVLAAPAAAQQPPPPRLLVAISVEGLSTALFDQYRQQFSGGFAELASGTEFRNGSSSPPARQALGDALKSQWPGSRDVAVSGQQGAATSFAGTHIDQRWFWSGNRFETDKPGARVPEVVPKVNAAVAAALAQPRPPLEATPSCEASPGASGSAQLARRAGDVAAFSASPELDGDTLGLAAGLVDEMQLGRGATPDMLAIGLAATANVERAYGAQSEQMCLQLTDLDREIGDFLALLDNRGIDFAVVLTGSGEGPEPVLLWRPGFRGAAVDAPASPADVQKTLAVLIGLPAAIDGRCLEGTPAFCS